MPDRIPTRQVEQLVFDVVANDNVRAGQSLPLKSVYAAASKHNLTQNDIANVLQSLKNKHFLTADERLTEQFFAHFENEAAVV